MNLIKKLNNILLIDDDEITNFVNKRAIKKLDCAHNVTICKNGPDALKYLKETTSEHLYPELVLLDINMPGMSGWDFLTHYETLPHEKKASLIVLMLTTSLNPDDAKKALNLEFVSGFKHKPLTPEAMKSIIQEYFPSLLA